MNGIRSRVRGRLLEVTSGQSPLVVKKYKVAETTNNLTVSCTGFSTMTCRTPDNRDLKIRRRRRQRERHKSSRFNNQNNNFARASRFFVHFFAVTAQLRREKWLISLFFLGFWRTRTQDNERLPFVRKFR